jgi:hypothetical protein
VRQDSVRSPPPMRGRWPGGRPSERSSSGALLLGSGTSCPSPAIGLTPTGVTRLAGWADDRSLGQRTVKTNAWVAGEPTPFVAMMVRAYLRLVPAAGVPEMVAVPFALAVKLNPLGSVPVSVIVAFG